VTYADMIADLRERWTAAKPPDEDAEIFALCFRLWDRIVDVLESVVIDQGVDPEGPNDYSTSEALCGKTEDLLTTWRSLQPNTEEE